MVKDRTLEINARQGRKTPNQSVKATGPEHPTFHPLYKWPGRLTQALEIPPSVSRREFSSERYLDAFAALRENISAALSSLALARIARYGLGEGLPNTNLPPSR